MRDNIVELFRSIKRNLFRTIFTKYLLATSGIIMVSFIVLGLLMSSFVSNSWMSERQTLLAENARNISQTAALYFERQTTPAQVEGEEPRVTYGISENYVDTLRTAIVMIGSSIQSDIFLVSAQGNVIICSEDTQTYLNTGDAAPADNTSSQNMSGVVTGEIGVPAQQSGASGASAGSVQEADTAQEGQQEVEQADIDTCRHRNHLPVNLIEEAAKTMEYRATDDLGGIYTEDHFVVGIPILAKNELGEDEKVAFVFAASSASSIARFRADTIRIVTISVLVAMIISLFAVYAITYQQVRPLRQMAAAVNKFARGDYNARVNVASEDEVGQLAASFNEMADTIAASETMRRSFIANVSHELKTPMQTISGFVDGILDGTIPPEKQSGYLRVVSEETKRLARMVRSMLDLSKIDSGEMKLNCTKFDISNTLFTTMLSFEQRIEDKHIDIQGMEDIRSLTVKGDPDLIHQVIYNLLDNAVKFTNDGGYIRLRVFSRDGYAHVCICNSGIGVPSDELTHIFDRFYKTDKSRSQDKTGVGLGLYIVKTIISLHAGRIEARSAEGSYCEFEFHIPLSGPHDANRRSRSQQE